VLVVQFNSSLLQLKKNRIFPSQLAPQRKSILVTQLCPFKDVLSIWLVSAKILRKYLSAFRLTFFLNQV
jgi:hypothetical protein